MLKDDHSMKEAEARAGEALRRLLERIPSLQIESIETEAVSGDWEPDLVARLFVDGRRHLLICEYKSNGQPRYARSALLELRNYIAERAPEATPVFIAPYISPAVRRLCEEKDVSYLDLEGNARIAFGGVFIERMVTDKPVAEQRELKSLFRAKSAQVLRVMLREPGRAWRVTELSEMSGVSLGHVSNVRTGLINREWARASDDGLVLSQPNALLDAWRDSYTAPSGEHLRFYTPLHGSMFEDAAQVLRVMLREPGRAWRVTELSEMSGVSLGHVSNVRTGLINREWARASDDGLVLSQPNALLDAWRDSYTAPSGEHLRFYTPLHGSMFEDAARTALRADDSPRHAAFASFSAAQWISPYGRTGTHYFFTDSDGLRKLQAALKLAPAAKGENVVITVPKDTGLLADTIEPAPGAVCTSLVQTYLDLSIAGERGAEAADHLRREKLSWPR